MKKIDQKLRKNVENSEKTDLSKYQQKLTYFPHLRAVYCYKGQRHGIKEVGFLIKKCKKLMKIQENLCEMNLILPQLWDKTSKIGEN